MSHHADRGGRECSGWLWASSNSARAEYVLIARAPQTQRGHSWQIAVGAGYAIAWPNVGGARSMSPTPGTIDAAPAGSSASVPCKWRPVGPPWRAANPDRAIGFGVRSRGCRLAPAGGVKPGAGQRSANARRVTSWRIDRRPPLAPKKRSVTVGRFGIRHAAGDPVQPRPQSRVRPSRGSSIPLLPARRLNSRTPVRRCVVPATGISAEVFEQFDRLHAVGR